MLLELDTQISHTVQNLLQEGYALYQQRDYTQALRLFYQAWVKLPKPQSQYEKAGEVLTAIGDSYFRLGRYEPAIEALRSALHCPQTQNDPQVLLRLGQCLLDSGQELQARTYLQRTYRLSGTDYFNNEDEKYLNIISDFII